MPEKIGERFLVIEAAARGSPMKVIVLKGAMSPGDREWVEKGAAIVVRLSDFKVATPKNGRIFWSDNPRITKHVFEGRFVIAEALIDGK